MPNPITKKQTAVLRFVRDWIERHGESPSQREIADHFGWRSNTAAVAHLRALVRKGYIQIEYNQKRGIYLL